MINLLKKKCYFKILSIQLVFNFNILIEFGYEFNFTNK